MLTRAMAFRLIFCLIAIGELKSVSAAPVTLADSLKVGDSIEHALSYGRRSFALPAGSWRVIYKRERPSSTVVSNAVPMLDIAFDQIVDGRVSQTMEITATKYSNAINWLDEPCKNKGDSFWIEDRKRSFNDQFCVRVGFVNGVVESARGDMFQAWARDILARGVSYSREMPFVRVTRFTSYDYLSITIAFDPEGAGIPRSQRSERALNDWHADIAEKDPSRNSFYRALKDWAPKFSDSVGRAFNGDSTLTTADYGSPSFPPR